MRAEVLRRSGDPNAAGRLLERAESEARELGARVLLQQALGEQAALYMDQRKWEPALIRLKEQERLCRELGDTRSLAICQGNRALIIGKRLHFPEEALPIAREAYRLADEHGLVTLAKRLKPIVEHAEWWIDAEDHRDWF